MRTVAGLGILLIFSEFMLGQLGCLPPEDSIIDAANTSTHSNDGGNRDVDTCPSSNPLWPEGITQDDNYCRGDVLYLATLTETEGCAQESETLVQNCADGCVDSGGGNAGCNACPILNDECPDGAESGYFCFEGDLFSCSYACFPDCGCDERRELIETCSNGCSDLGNDGASCLSESSEALVFSAQSSVCGGFVSEGTPSDAELAAYCAAERLLWTYDDQAERLTVVDARADLNCCGERSIQGFRIGEVYYMHEVDSPEEEGRCSCLCVYDFEIALQVGAVRELTLSLTREVTDVDSTGQSEAMQLNWQGVLDLAQGSGEVILDTTRAEGCGF